MQTHHDLIAQSLPVSAASKAIAAKQGPTVLTSTEMKLVSGGAPKSFWAPETAVVLAPKSTW